MKKGTKAVLRYLLLFIVVALATLISHLYFSSRSEVTYQAPPPAVEVSHPERRTLSRTVDFFGYVAPEKMAPTVPFVSGTVLSFPHEVGDELEKDDVICTLDKRPYELQLKQAEAQYLALSSSFERVESLYESGAVPRQEYDTLKAQADAAKAQLELASLQLSYADVTTPISGTIISKNGGVGSIGTSTSPIAVVADLSSLVVDVDIPERYFGEVFPNKDDLSIKVTAADGGDGFDAELVSIASVVDPTSKDFKMRIRLSEGVPFIPGMYVRVHLEWGERKDVLTVERRLLNHEGGLYHYLDGVVHYIVPEVLFETDDYVQIGDEYEEYLFVTKGESQVFDGGKVNVVGGEN